MPNPSSFRKSNVRSPEEEVSSNICRQIKEHMDLFVDPENLLREKGSKCKITFTFEGKPTPYTTEFKVEYNKDAGLIIIANKCINIAFSISKEGNSYRYDTNELDSSLSANSQEKGCFNPTLISDSRNKPGVRVNATDILQTLKTKLTFCLMPNNNSTTILDIAAQNGLIISRFNILRGLPAIYEKYGYKSKLMGKFKKYINRLKWEDLDESLKKYIRVLLTKESEPLESDSLTDIMKRISFEYELTLSNSEGTIPSNIIWSNLSDQYELEDEDEEAENEEAVSVYTLKKTDKSWNSWNRKLLFTDFTSDATVGQSAGSRTRRTSTRRRRRTMRRSI